MMEKAMKVAIDALGELRIRNDYVVLVGGGAVNEQSALAVGADVYCRDASKAAETARAFGTERQSPVAV